MSSFCNCKSYSHFFSKNISVYTIFNDQSVNVTLTNDIASFEQLGLLLFVPALADTQVELSVHCLHMSAGTSSRYGSNVQYGKCLIVTGESQPK